MFGTISDYLNAGKIVLNSSIYGIYVTDCISTILNTGHNTVSFFWVTLLLRRCSTSDNLTLQNILTSFLNIGYLQSSHRIIIFEPGWPFAPYRNEYMVSKFIWQTRTENMMSDLVPAGDGLGCFIHVNQFDSITIFDLI